jgi:hypothetical protein
VDHAGGDVVRLVVGEPTHHLLVVSDVVGAGLAVAVRPALDLAVDVAGAPAERVQPGLRGVDRVQLDQHVEKAVAERARVARGQRHPRRQVATQDGAFETLHHVEVRADHVVVVAERDHLRHVGEHRREPVLDRELAVHVVRALRLVPHRGPAQDQVPAGVAQQVGEVRRAAGELAHLGHAVETCLLPRLLAQPVGDDRDVEGVLVAHGLGVGHLSHRALSCSRSITRVAVARIWAS